MCLLFCMMQVTVKHPRGVEIANSNGGFLSFGSASEHSALWQYNFHDSSNLTFVLAQTETPYWQYPPSAWAMTVENVNKLRMYAVAFWNWLEFQGPQDCLINIKGSTDVAMYGVSAMGVSLVRRR